MTTNELATVTIAYAHNGTVHTVFMESLLFTLAGQEAHVSLSGRSGLYVDNNRNLLVKEFLEVSNNDWLWMLDTDVAFPPGVLTRLLADADPVEAPIVSALYLGFADGQARPVWYLRDEGKPFPPFRAIAEIPPQRLTRLDGVGMGCCLMHRSALERIGQVFPEDPWRWFGRDIVDTSQGPCRLGEDLSFCHRAGLAEIPIWGSNISVQHLKLHPVALGSSGS